MSHSPELRRQIEDLALRLVVEDSTHAMPASWIPVLERIRDSAAREQAGRVSTAAAAILDGIRECGEPDSGRIAIALQEGIISLQQALEVEPQSETVHDLPLAQDPELLSDFILESREHLVAIEAQ